MNKELHDLIARYFSAPLCSQAAAEAEYLIKCQLRVQGYRFEQTQAEFERLIGYFRQDNRV